MTCPNCGSNEIAPIQGENFCINCGQLLPPTPEPKPSPAPGVAPTPLQITVEAPEVKVTSPPKKRPVGRPKKPRLDVALVKTVSADTTSTIPAIAHTFPQPEMPLPTTNAASTPVQRTIDTVRAPITAPVVQAHARHEHRVRVWRILSHALEVLNSPIYYVQLVPVILVASLPVSVVIMHRLTSHTLWQLPLSPELAVQALQLLLGVAATIAVLVMAKSAIIYGRARSRDHRPQPGHIWVDMAVMVFGRLIGLWTVMLVQLGLAVALLVALVVYGSYALALPSWLQDLGVFGLALYGWYYIGSLIVAWSLAGAAITLSDTKLLPALQLGYRAYRRHFELLGALIGTIVLQALFVSALIGGWLYARELVGDPASVLVAAVLGIIGFMGVCALAAGAAEASYREVVMLDHSPKVARMLVGRIPTPVSWRAQCVPVALIVILGAIIIALNYLPTQNVPQIPGLIG